MRWCTRQGEVRDKGKAITPPDIRLIRLRNKGGPSNGQDTVFRRRGCAREGLRGRSKVRAGCVAALRPVDNTHSPPEIRGFRAGPRFSRVGKCWPEAPSFLICTRFFQKRDCVAGVVRVGCRRGRAGMRCRGGAMNYYMPRGLRAMPAGRFGGDGKMPHSFARFSEL